MLPVFEDRYPNFDGNRAYLHTNEEPDVFRALLMEEGRPLVRTGGICSGGDVPMLALLPLSQEVVAIDHCYKSLGAAYMKALLLADLGPVLLTDLLRVSNFSSIANSMGTLMPQVPSKLQAGAESLWKSFTPTSLYAVETMYKHWVTNTPQSVLKDAYDKLDRIKFVHGDLRDLDGQFDIVYTSNAQDHDGRHGFTRRDNLVHILSQGGGLMTAGPYYQEPPSSDWKIVKSVRGKSTSWTHEIHRRKLVETVSK